MSTCSGPTNGTVRPSAVAIGASLRKFGVRSPEGCRVGSRSTPLPSPNSELSVVPLHDPRLEPLQLVVDHLAGDGIGPHVIVEPDGVELLVDPSPGLPAEEVGELERGGVNE